MTKELILGLDIGTSSVRAALYDMRGDLIPKTLVKNERTLTATHDGGAEIDAGTALIQILASVSDVLSIYQDEAAEIAYLATSSFWHSLVGVDTNGNPTTKVFGWADTRSRKYTERLEARFDESAIHDRTGARFHSSFWPAKLLWLRTEFPDVFARTARWLSFSDFVALNLFGEAATSVSMASGTGLLDLRTCSWDDKLLKFLKLRPEQLPTLPEDKQTFRLSKKFAKRWPRLKSAECFPAIADGAANNIGAGCVTRSKAALMIGTSGAMRVAYRGEPPAKIPPGLWCYRIDRKRVIMGGALSDGGGLYRWMKDNLRLGKDDDVEREIAKREPAAHGLSVMPFFAGERSTGYHENAVGSILGLRSSSDTIDIVQAALESIAYRFADIFDQLNGLTRIKNIIASGGALRESPVWTQMIADVLGRDLTLPDTREASMRGAVLLALETTGRINKIEDVPTPSGKKFSADKSRKAVYSAARKRHRETYKLLIDRET
ncbi:MAG: carbohydrate kinase [Acidobacteria bacterium]|nr:MAG: carbohydrate kinase [Acidobacteriota bacterium]